MSIQFYRNVSIICFVLSGLLFILSVILFIKLNISKVIGDLTGNSARRAIKSINEQSARAISKRNMPKPVYFENRGVQAKNYSSQSPIAPINKTGIDKNVENVIVQPMSDQNETTLLVDDNSNNISYDVNLSDITESLEGLGNLYANNQAVNEYELELDITYLHTNDIIL
ncbi:hypothetical protein [Acetivibrio clariflavus]|uniref:Uncharacterized protein n=1 Tax=Acetivibrio clariflavus (strain DSM 19732 / NBRC 101661 / EBR45) TaxID=720554 RepID=G8LSA4_ACECE|nr:hypothetical protein [Acetivibrio clariflavus]AEV67165.1 hypothetical protein Clocl_0437 [Acetivibrio clariflavus DSM 19732]HOQ02158.1 hypothetical protein [Acetivibrio clariflavus]